MSTNLLAGRYKLVKSLGEGGMADVHLAIDTIINREVAVKILRGELGNDPVTLLRFQREANAASKLNHPNVVQVYDVGAYEDRHFIVMEYIRGRTLKQLIQLRGALHKEEAISIMKQLLSAISEAHKQNIIHRDIKPQNVLIKDDGTVKITDFGIALAHNAVQLTQTDAVLGSAHYLPPEITRGEVATVQSDIYSLGIVFYELLCGSVPFNGENPVQIAMKHLREDIPSVKEFNPSLPQSIENIILKATAKNRKFRYESVEEMLNDVDSCLNEEHLNDKKITFEEIKEVNEITKTVLVERYQESKVEEPKKESRWFIGVIAGIITTVLLVGILYLSGFFTYITTPKTAIIPDVSTMSIEEAKEQLLQLGFVVKTEIIYEGNDNVPVKQVIRTIPSIQTEQEIGTSITLVLSKGKGYVVENYVDKNIDKVKDELEKIGIEVNYTTIQSDKKVGTILSQKFLKEGETIYPEYNKYQVDFTVASEKEFVMIGVIGKHYSEAKKMIEDLGGVVEFVVLNTANITPEELENIKVGHIVAQTPDSGSYYIQSKGSVITLTYYE